MDGIKMSVISFEKYIVNTSDHVWYGILKREFFRHKNTLSGWRQVIEDLKRRPANAH